MNSLCLIDTTATFSVIWGFMKLNASERKTRKLICEAQTRHYSFDAEIIHQWQDELITTYPDKNLEIKILILNLEMTPVTKGHFLLRY